MSEMNYPTPVAQMWFEDLKFCGCGSPEMVLTRMRDTMRALKARSEFWRSDEGRRTAYDAPKQREIHNALRNAAGPDEVSQYMMFYVLDAAGLEEHGGSVPGWLTEKGEKILAFLEGNKPEDWMGDSDES